MVWQRILAVKFIGGVLGMGVGLPSGDTATLIASVVANITTRMTQRRAENEQGDEDAARAPRLSDSRNWSLFL